MRGGTIAIYWGRYGGWSLDRTGISTRLCLGWVAVAYLSGDLDVILRNLLKRR